ncbi:hypothetical protein ASF32_23405 [Methylobacterium sp. Leaf91]|nr:hypothetical protein ASF24_19240 [Methylobacterium sp. Leaf86]KQO89698.1 hypothetical protein ASF32_23405 [Methylobacterium sp. Leaf91]
MRDVNGFPKIYAIINEVCQPARVIKVETLTEGELLPEQYRGMHAIQILDEAPVKEGYCNRDGRDRALIRTRFPATR